MVGLMITTNCELNPWQDYQRETVREGSLERVGLMPRGTASGRPALLLGIRIGKPASRRVVIAQTTWALWKGAMRGLAGSPVAELDLMDQELGGHDQTLETLTMEYEARLKAEGMRAFASYLEAHPFPAPCSSGVYAELAREKAGRMEATGNV